VRVGTRIALCCGMAKKSMDVRRTAAGAPRLRVALTATLTPPTATALFICRAKFLTLHRFSTPLRCAHFGQHRHNLRRYGIAYAGSYLVHNRQCSGCTGVVMARGMA